MSSSDDVERGPQYRNWTADITALLKTWGMRCKDSRRMHVRSADFYLSVDRFLGLIHLIITVLATAYIGTQTAVECSSGDGGGSPVWFLSGTIILGIISGIQNMYGFGKKSEKHHKWADDYAVLVSQIETQLCLNPNNRTAVDGFVKQVSKDYNRLLHTTTDIPYHIRRGFTSDEVWSFDVAVDEVEEDEDTSAEQTLSIQEEYEKRIGEKLP